MRICHTSPTPIQSADPDKLKGNADEPPIASLCRPATYLMSAAVLLPSWKVCALSGRETESVPCGVGEHLHPRSDNAVRLLEKVDGIGFFIRRPERVGLWERENEEGLERPIG